MIKKIAAECSRLLIGMVFVFSGLVKAIDPIGGAIKFQDYFSAFGFEGLSSFTLLFSFALAVTEFALGVCMLLGVYRRYISALILIFMLFMTPLTLYLALANPVSDCGCFGEALVITNWETFLKNVVLLGAAVLTFKYNQLLFQCYTFHVYWFVALYSYIFGIGFAYLNYRNLPIVDFRPYKVGTHIPTAMSVPEGASQAEYSYAFVYEKDGVRKEFTLDDYPEGDSTWTFVEQKIKLLKPGYEPSIQDFAIYDLDETDITDTILHNDRGVFLMVSSKLEKADDSHIELLNNVYDFAKEYAYPFYCLTASMPEAIEEWSNNTGAEYPFCFVDETTLKTIIRSNPGLMLVKDGTIMAKWSDSQIPEEEELKPFLQQALQGKYLQAKEGRRWIHIVLSFTLPLLLVFVYDYFVNRKKKKTKREKRNKD